MVQRQKTQKRSNVMPIRNRIKNWWLLTLTAVIMACWACDAQAQAPCQVTSTNGVMPIVTKANPSLAVSAAARALAEKLKAITGADFPIITGDGRTGIALGLFNDFPYTGSDGWPYRGYFGSGEVVVTRTEDYAIRTHAKGIWIAAATDKGISHAIWGLLHHIGYRQFFPTQNWEVFPTIPELLVKAIDEVKSPDYYSRDIWYGYGTWNNGEFGGTDDTSTRWRARNRMGKGIVVNSSHSYDDFVRRHAGTFDQHDEYFTELNGVRQTPAVRGQLTTKSDMSKFDNSNEHLRKLIEDDVMARFAADPSLQSVSLEPSDGDNWGNSQAENDLGSIADRVVTLSNQVAAAVDQAYPNKKYIGIYAYGAHSAPPTKAVHPRTVVSVATAYLHTGYTVDQLIDGWRAKGVFLGMYDYYAVNSWDRDLPGLSNASNLSYIASSIPNFHNRSARFMSAESSNSWGPNGLGYYLASRLLWDRTEKKDDIVTDFLTNAFGKKEDNGRYAYSGAAPVMRGFYNLIDGANKPLLSTDLINNMYSTLKAGLAAATDEKVKNRIYDLAVYTRYVELYWIYTNTTDNPNTTSINERYVQFEKLMRFVHQIHTTQMVHSRALWYSFLDQPGDTKMYEEMPAALKGEVVNEDGNKVRAIDDADHAWKSNPAITADDINGWITEGSKTTNYPVIRDFDPVVYSPNLIPATPLNLSGTGGDYLYIRNPGFVYSWNDTATAASSANVNLSVTGHYVDYRPNADITVTLFPRNAPNGASVDTDKAKADKISHDISLTTNYSGLQAIHFQDYGGGYNAVPKALPGGLPGGHLTIPMSVKDGAELHGRYTLYFYVPKGTKVVGGYSWGGPDKSDTSDKLLDGAGSLRYTFDNVPGYWKADVHEGQDGKLWKFQSAAARRALMTVPPYAARSASELLLPQEVVWSSSDLVPAAPLSATSPVGDPGYYNCLRFKNTVHLWSPSAPTTFHLGVRGGVLYSGGGGNITLDLYAGDGTGSRLSTVAREANGVYQLLPLEKGVSGSHTVKMNDNLWGYEISSAAGTPFTFPVTLEQPTQFIGPWSMYFYVPKGTKTVSGYSWGGGDSNTGDQYDQIRDSRGVALYNFNGKAEPFNIAVPDGEDGKLWKFHSIWGARSLISVPPYVARSKDELLLPSWIVQKDKP